MNRPRITIIAALAANGIIGRAGSLPWRALNEMRHFRQTTRNAVVIIGHVTAVNLPAMLPERMTIVVSRDKDLKAGCEIRTTLASALEAAAERPGREVFIAGGEKIFRGGLAFADRLLLSKFDFDAEGDSYFPLEKITGWQLSAATPGRPGEHRYVIEEYLPPGTEVTPAS